jgi:hypothetical protein
MGTTWSSAYACAGDERLDSCFEKAMEAVFFKLEGATAEVCAGFVEYGRCGRKGIATENLEARKRVR